MTNESNIRVVVDGNRVLRLEPEVGRNSEKALAAHYSLYGRSVENEANNHWGRELGIVSPFISEKIISTITSALYEQNNRQ